MDLTFHGANCFRVATKNASIIVDDNLAALGGKSITKADSVLLQTYEQAAVDTKPRIILDGPGEYEVSDVSIIGVAARSHMGEEKSRTATMFKLISGDVSIVFLGHVFEDLTDSQLEELGHVDVLVVPVGNKGYTLDGEGALKVIKKIDPSLVIPSHFADSTLKYEVSQDDLGDALKGLGMEPTETVPKLKLRANEMTDTLKLIVLERQ